MEDDTIDPAEAQKVSLLSEANKKGRSVEAPAVRIQFAPNMQYIPLLFLFAMDMIVKGSPKNTVGLIMCCDANGNASLQPGMH